MGESFVAEWRNWQTHQTQNLAKFTLREGSTPSSATNQIKSLEGFSSLLLKLLFEATATTLPPSRFFSDLENSCPTSAF
jgi:hypothetical protein